MRFADEVVSFEFADVPVVGCMRTGCVIGLTAQGAAVCDRLFKEDVPTEDVASVDPALLDRLRAGGFFDSEGEPADGEVLSAYVHVTQRCNLACVGCYSMDSGRNVLPDAPLEDVCRAVGALARAGARQLVVSGGEPFLRDDLPDILACAKREGVAAVAVLSNGLCLTREKLERVAPYADRVSVSFDGCSADAPAPIRGRQRFDQLVEAVRMVREAGISAHIIPTVHARNVDDLGEYVRLARGLDATINFSLLTCEKGDAALSHLVPGDDELRSLGRALLDLGEGASSLAMDAPIGMNLAARKNCGAGFRTLSVAADGTVYPCHMLHRPEFAMGNAFSGSVCEALSSPVSQRFRALDAKRFDGCRTCRYLHLCGGGCRARSVFSAGDLESPDSYCLMTQSFYDALANTLQSKRR